MSKTVQDRT